VCVLYAPRANAEPLNLFNLTLAPPVAIAAVAPPVDRVAESRAPAWIAGESAASLAINGVLVFTPAALFLASALPPPCTNCWFPELQIVISNILLAVTIAGGLTAPFLSSLAVWGIGRSAGRDVDYWNMAGISFAIRGVAFVLGLILTAVPLVGPWGIAGGFALGAIGGTVAEVVLENRAAPTPNASAPTPTVAVARF
jgi:hypothetical protein